MCTTKLEYLLKDSQATRQMVDLAPRGRILELPEDVDRAGEVDRLERRRVLLFYLRPAPCDSPSVVRLSAGALGDCRGGGGGGRWWIPMEEGSK